VVVYCIVVLVCLYWLFVNVCGVFPVCYCLFSNSVVWLAVLVDDCCVLIVLYWFTCYAWFALLAALCRFV